MRANLIDLISIFLIKGTNMLAVRGIDRGVADYLDTECWINLCSYIFLIRK